MYEKHPPVSFYLLIYQAGIFPYLMEYLAQADLYPLFNSTGKKL
jgi:hypothetical protein